MLTNKFRVIPSVEQLRQRTAVRLLEVRFGHDAVVEALREETESVRTQLIKDSSVNDDIDREDILRQIENGLKKRLCTMLRPSLRRVINATGVIVHTNLGRAPLAHQAIDRIATIAGYSNLEFDLDQGERGSRTVHARTLMQRLTGAEDTAVVNNNAAAILLTLSALAAGREVIISRGELVEIGGGFRIPDVLRQSGANLREIGTTNRTRPSDYAAAINDNTALILRVHPSNFRIEGFAERPSVEAVTEIGQRFAVPVVEDLGSGNLLDHLAGAEQGAELKGEPTVSASLTAGVSVCCFSGDKLLGGPQAGVIVGRREQLKLIHRHPLMRALRVDKMVFAALEATLLEYVAGRAAQSVPVQAMIHATVESLQQRALLIINALADTPGLSLTCSSGNSTIGGGTAPGVTIPTCLLQIRLNGCNAGTIETRLRQAEPPIIGRIQENLVLLDLRTVQPHEDATLTAALAKLETSPSED
jgi:L-seryl-tRNA(Ser) seleniumtransferase